MIATRTPFRISYVGGGTDMPCFYEQRGGAVVSAAISRHMFLFVHPTFNGTMQIKYNQTERVRDVSQIQHPIVRETLRRFELTGLDVNSIADIPSGTGLGSSSAFAVGFLHALYALTAHTPSKEQLAREAADIEINRVGSPIGKQDQYATAFGGLALYEFQPDGAVVRTALGPDRGQALASHTVLFFLGEARDANSLLVEQRRRALSGEATKHLDSLKNLAYEFFATARQGDLESCGHILHKSWVEKRQVSPLISNDTIDDLYRRGCKAGAWGGKLLGAGGTGFLMFLCPPARQEDLKRALSTLRNFQWSLDHEGSVVIRLSVP